MLQSSEEDPLLALLSDSSLDHPRWLLEFHVSWTRAASPPVPVAGTELPIAAELEAATPVLDSADALNSSPLSASTSIANESSSLLPELGSVENSEQANFAAAQTNDDSTIEGDDQQTESACTIAAEEPLAAVDTSTPMIESEPVVLDIGLASINLADNAAQSMASSSSTQSGSASGTVSGGEGQSSLREQIESTDPPATGTSSEQRRSELPHQAAATSESAMINTLPSAAPSAVESQQARASTDNSTSRSEINWTRRIFTALALLAVVGQAGCLFLHTREKQRRATAPPKFVRARSIAIVD